MTVQSYLVYTDPGQTPAVRDALNRLPGCEVIPAENRELLVLVTASEDAREQAALEDNLYSVGGVKCLALVAGWTE